MSQFINPFTIATAGTVIILNAKSIGNSIVKAYKEEQKRAEEQRKFDDHMRFKLLYGNPTEMLEAKLYFAEKERKEEKRRMEMGLLLLRGNNMRMERAHNDEINEMKSEFTKFQNESQKEKRRMDTEISRLKFMHLREGNAV